ncbi:MAG: 2Fe-2S iron-sulfur cluster binding domain-containing protein [Alphaproteobacteria bacterium]|nr:2Fe-2S iron-sulfur cluster binding domain-containing protein [Alphaproteobacteria bacterium]
MPSYRVTLLHRDGASFPVGLGQTILDAAELAGVPLLAGCRTGACLTCAARLVVGKVHVPDGTALTQEMVDAHVVLPCVCTVGADCELEVGRPGRTLLHPRHLHPWTD